jgi:glucosamine--fructose-6-phosphate aminotransferase (isomerizing)
MGKIMCGIIGYTGTKEAEGILLDTLKLLEYRGYDSAGLAVADDRGKICMYKCAGRVSKLKELCDHHEIKGTCGIGHTRWATHGGVTDANAHPHQWGKVTLVHNGIIENYQQLSEKFWLMGKLRSETDSEIVAAVLDSFYQGNPMEAIKKTIEQLEGTYALVMMFEDQPGKIFAVRNVSPIVAGKSETGAILASDVAALGTFVHKYFVVPEHCILELTKEQLMLTDINGSSIEQEWLTIDWDTSAGTFGDYSCYMEKEIMEQPEVIRRTFCNRVVDGLPDFSKDGIEDSLFTDIDHVCFIGCGTAMHVGLIGKSLMQSMLGIHVDVELASEFMYSDPVVGQKTLVIAISQSGETIDTLEALKYAKAKGAKCLSIINVKGASIARESSFVIYTQAGPEIAVASTKAFTTQLTVLYLITAQMGLLRGVFTKQETQHFIHQLERTPDAIAEVLARRQQIKEISENLIAAKDAFMIGRGMDYSMLLEGALKLKEISYIHCEAYASGELKHGTIVLITQDTPVIAVATQKELRSKELSNMREVIARGAEVILFTRASDQLTESAKWNHLFLLPELEDAFMVMPASVALQLLAFYTAAGKGLDVDKPRNLAKVVTVE